MPVQRTSIFPLTDHKEEHSTNSIFDTPKNVKRTKRLLLFLIGFGVCGLLFLAGYLGGYFTPRESSQTPAKPASQRKWVEEPCIIPDQNQCPPGYAENPPLLVISFDGFRAEYLERNLTRALDRVRKCGVSAKSMRSSYPSITFPNHYTIATGLHVESHGIVDNKFYDPERGQFDYKNPEHVADPYWWGGEPIWVTAQKQGKRSHAFFWVGTEAPIQDVRPDNCSVFNSSIPFETRVDTVLDWLSSPEKERPAVTMLYFEEPDSAGHKFGTHGENITNMIGRVDAVFERLMQGLFDKHLLNCVNIIVVSDHGMTDTNSSEALAILPVLQSHPNTANVTMDDIFFSGGPLGRLSRRNSSNITVDDVYESLRCPVESGGSSVYQVYTKNKMPIRYHYTNTDRVEPVIINVNEGHQVWPTVNPNAYRLGGTHGYDSLYDSMDAIFLGFGPSFKSQLETEEFQNIEVYNLLCDLIGVEPAPNNGTYGSLHDLLRAPKPLERSPYVKHERTEPLGSQNPPSLCGDGCNALGPSADLGSAGVPVEFAEQQELYLAPHGVPEASKNQSTVLLINPKSVVLYSETLKTPLWTSVRLRNDSIKPWDRSCVQIDPRVGLSCEELATMSTAAESRLYGLRPAVVQSRIALSSSLVPLHQEFLSYMWPKMWELIEEWVQVEGEIFIQVGPVFDDLYPYGLPDENVTRLETLQLPIPSHIFFVVTRELCERGRCRPDAIAFLIPHDREPRSHCQDARSYILTHTARVRDVEAVTGLRFFTRFDTRERARLLTQLHKKLWHSQRGL